MRYLLVGIILLSSLFSWSQVDFSAVSTEGCTPLGVTINVTNPPATDISSYLWEITGPLGNVTNSASPFYVAIFSEPGTYDVTLTINGVNGIESATEVDYITIHANPEANFSVNDTEGCFPFCVDFSDITVSGGGTIVEWSWDFGNGVTTTEQNPSYCYPEIGVYTPVFSVEDEFGCYNDYSAPGLIWVADQFPDVQASSGYQLNCNPPADFIFSNTSSGASELTYEWNFGDGSPIVTADSEDDVTYSYAAVGSYDACITAIDDIGCESEMCIPIEVFDQAEAAFNVSETVICLGEQIAFTDDTSPPPVSWSWDFDGDGNEDSNEQNPVYTYQGEGNYAPELTVTYSSNCTDSESGIFNVEVAEALIIDFAPDTAISCQTPFTVNFDNLTTGPGNLTYTWEVDGVFYSNAEDVSYNFDAFANYDIELMVSSDNGCSGTQLYSDLIQIQEPQISFSNPTVICTEDPVDIFDIDWTSIDPIIDWLWDFNEDNIIDYNGPNPDYSYEDPGVYDISVDILTAAGCTSSFTSSQTITVETQVETTFTVSDTVTCAGEVLTFCVPEQMGVTYAWNFGDVIGWDYYQSWDTCAVHDYQDTGYFDITLSVFNDGCNHIITYEDFVYVGGPVALFEITQDCGDMLTVDFTETSILADSVLWDFGDGTDPVWNVSNPSHTYPGPGTYEVTLTAINDDVGCPDITTASVLVVAPDPSLNFSEVEGCPPLAVDVTNNTYNIYWEVDYGNGDWVIVNWNNVTAQWEVEFYEDGVTTYDTFSPNQNFWPTVTYDDLGVYDVTVTSLDENGCQSMLVYDDAISVSSQADFAYFDINVVESCDSVTIGFEPTATNLTSWEWTFSDGTIVTDQTPQHTFLAPYDYQLTATFEALDDEGCTSVITQEIDLVPPAFPDFTIVTDPSCQGDLIDVTNDSWGDIAGYSWDFGDPAAGASNYSTEENPSFSYENNGSFEICLTVENSAGCETTSCQPNGVNIINPIADFTYDVSINNCLFGVQFENTTGGTVNCSEWFFGDDQFGAGMSVFHTYPIGVYDLELVVCNEFGCYDTIVAPDIFDYANVIGPFSASLDTVSCAPMTVDLSAWNIDDDTFTYFWDFNDGFGDPNGVTVTQHVYETPGVYCPSLIMTDSNGCPVLIECENPIVVEEFVFATTALEEICFGETFTFEVEGATTYEWLDETYVTQLDDETFELDPDVTTDFLITGYFADCVSEQPFTLTVNQLPIVDLAFLDEICFNEPVLPLSGGSPNDIPGVYYIDGVEATDFDPSSPAETSYSILYEYTDANGCLNSATQDIYINSLPDVQLAAYNPFCANDAVYPLDGGTPVGGQFQIDGTDATDFDPAVGNGTYAVDYIFTDANGCSESDSETIEVNPIPELIFDVLDPCVTDLLVVTNGSTIEEGSIDNVSWDFGPLGTSDLFNPLPIDITDAGNYDITLEATSDLGCVTTMTQAFDVFDTPIADFSFENDCVGGVFDVSDASNIETGNISTWEWEIDGLGSYDGQNISQQIDTWGSYEIQLTITSDNGCVDVVTNTLEVYPNPVVNFMIDEACEQSEAFFINQTSIPATSISSYSWTFGDGATSGDSDPVNVYDEYGSYDVTLTATSEFGCVGLSSETIQVYPLPIADFELDIDGFCAGGEINLSDLSTVVDPSMITQWQWAINGQSVGFTQGLNYTLEQPGLYDISLAVITNNGCISDTTINDAVNVWPFPDANFSADLLDTDLLNTTMVFEDQSIGATDWSYDFGDGTFEVGQNAIHGYDSYGNYDVWLYVANEFGCSDAIMQTIEISPQMLVYVPNAFTPDNDGRNDVFFPEITGFDIEQYNFQIWNRWGELIFETDQIDQPWTGDVRGGEHYAPYGVYVWKILLQNSYTFEIEEISGHVTLIR